MVFMCVCMAAVLTLARRGQTWLIQHVDVRAEVPQVVSLHTELNHVLQPHLIRTVDHELIVLQHTQSHT